VVFGIGDGERRITADLLLLHQASCPTSISHRRRRAHE
jgi:hypothetical protein